MQHVVVHNHNVNSSLEERCLPRQAVSVRLDGPPSPLDVVCNCAGDEADWVSYPAFYPHVVRLQSDEQRPSYGVRMRGADGQLKLLHGPEQDLEEVRRQVELRWLYFLDACLRTPRYGEEEKAEELHYHLYTLEKGACPQSLPGVRSPFQAFDFNEIDQADLCRYPVGYPFVVFATDVQDRYSTMAMMRTEDLKFRTLREITSTVGEGEHVIKWCLTLEVPGIECADWMSVRAVTRFHVDHCQTRGVRARPIRA